MGLAFVARCEKRSEGTRERGQRQERVRENSVILKRELEGQQKKGNTQSRRGW